MRRRRVLTILAAAAGALATGSLGRAAPPPRLWQGRALGAEARIVLHGDPDQTRAALAAAQLAIAEAERRWSLFRSDSDLARLNRAGALADVDGPWHALIDLCDRVHAATGGLFDPTIQPLWQALATGADPEAARATIGWGRLARPGAGRRALRLAPGQALTLNGIAQGAATDAVRAALAAAGLTRALIETGETAALGGPFRLGIADPALGLVGRLRLAEGAVAVSSPGALRLAGGAAHILAPDGRAPLWTTVAVEAESAALADGLATAAVLMPAPEVAAAARALGGVRLVILAGPDGAIRLDGRAGAPRRIG